MATVFRINARELLRRPGLTKEIRISLPAAELGIDDERVTGDLTVDVRAVSGVDEITVAGTISVPWSSACRRCLTVVGGVREVELHEVYRDDVDPSDDAFEITGDQIDVAPAIREHVLLELPDAPLCRADCAGLCPVCGADRNVAPCECDTTVRDERWAVLDELRMEPDSPGDGASDGPGEG